MVELTIKIKAKDYSSAWDAIEALGYEYRMDAQDMVNADGIMLCDDIDDSWELTVDEK